MTTTQSKLVYRKPTAEDGGKVWQLVKDTQVLDLNSAYSYIMFCDYFADTCVVAESDGAIVGFVSAFCPPGNAETLFVWQVAVDSSQRGKGVATELLRVLMQREACRQVNMVELTISPSNQASRALFMRMARELNTDMNVRSGYAAALFPGGGHEDEELYQIGPIPSAK
ncbi:diaminobutyrate acetyltransferase [Xylanibacillus composti]|uniref:L-2,4-diaminobutyric acid acetyltransferase n=1 Tax=Xylanibacillus composti TaxID=1572762 RepID=A0A8J4M2C3_9BACL|nr:diaminobutyrate acetyltransferase [Xylanibacillus composti]GIQ68975.1 L-2,4-diaminobutyric acid acetyltransferase [Xylanibacillus composti]